jgi:glycosyltransferase involved in cell wall biosynthesis
MHRNKTMKFSIIIPSRNEAENLKILLPKVQKALEGIDCEIIVVDNGSTDDSAEILKDLKKTIPNLGIAYEPIPGYGRAVLAGLKTAKGGILGIIRADNQEKPDDLAAMYVSFSGEKQPSIFKAIRKSRAGDGAIRVAISKIYNILFQAVFGLRTKDINATPKIFTQEFYRNASLESLDWFIDAEIVIKAAGLGYAINEAEIEYLPRLKGKSNVRPSHICQFLANIIVWGVRFRNGKLLAK